MSESETKGEIIQYVPFMSFVHPSFWHTLTEMKIDVDKLSENTRQIFGRFTYRDDLGPVFEVDGTSFNRHPEKEQFCESVTGKLMNKNTIEEFKAIDKADLINSIGEILWADLKKEKNWIVNPGSLLNFVILSFADLKKFHYFYWFAFPAPSQPTVYLREKSKSIAIHFSNKQLDYLAHAFKSLDDRQKSFFILTKNNDNVAVHHLSKLLNPNDTVQSKLDVDLSNTYFTFLDSSNGSNPGWSLRLFLAALFDHVPSLASSDIQVIGLRCSPNGEVGNSLVFTIKGSQDLKSVESAGWVGWERNDKGNFGPKLANMSASMDPIKLADTSSDLNIKLMKWRLVPDINVEVMKTNKCLLLGAGTLGCHVARNLLAWGFRNITFIDNGKVSYSNPTRQVLYNYEDCLGGGKRKAEAAADNLKAILPTVKSRGITAHIPMPGHPVGESLKEETIANIQNITQAIAEHDVIFLLLDTREARWLPTLIAAHYKKIVINAALGFDSYLVMRHGVGKAPAPENTSIKKAFIEGGQLGCYFCNDVTAPGNSLKDRTLDQQCTVTRPGVAAIAGALAVEILVGLLQHPQRVEAPALYNVTGDDASDLPSETQGVLGHVPHSIRGFLHSYQTVVPTCAKFKQCIACSDVVLDKYKNEGTEFLLNVFNSGSYLEDVTGLSQLHLAAEMTDVLTFSDDGED
ncbi:ubiquitin-like modifier-activating enzyme ATG7 [Ostrinia furnacalis]|uniref:ubiquitin-like modifier-activating enzyme ATG7 n=1 Tax=Ostrinia furnacalis TaxID=93504 RepID=UPI001039A64B|nr:ubiquitin-like modifier-activating enzyme ATG7 [Ostrinia furnacalis]